MSVHRVINWNEKGKYNYIMLYFVIKNKNTEEDPDSVLVVLRIVLK